MKDGPDETSRCVGFLTVVEHPEWGATGGYLILNALGRPLEFHCTAPVRITRAQEILYGPALKPCLYGEQIARALVEKSRQRPTGIFTDQIPVMALRHVADVPVAVVCPQSDHFDDGQIGPCSEHVGERQLMKTEGWIRLTHFHLDGQSVAVLTSWQHDKEVFLQAWQGGGWWLDLSEPFQRIREAIAEAQQAAAVATGVGKS